MTAQPHGIPCWYEISTRDPKAAFAFYGRHLGWTESRAMDMGPDGTYHIFARGGQDLGGMFALRPGMPAPFWLPYFGADGVDKALAASPRPAARTRWVRTRCRAAPSSPSRPIRRARHSPW